MGGGVNLISSTPANAIGKEVTSADFIKSDIQSNLLNYTTNRILEIPQDIKLEIVDGVLILRAGSKVCVPVGFEEDEQTRKFSFITTTRDLSYTEPNQISATFHVYAYYKNGEITGISRRGENNSGSTVPSDNYNGAFYNTTTNNVEQYRNGSLSDISSLPLGLVTSVAKEGNNISAIDQIFNGFGYIGSTIFALPGIKCQFADGRNEDGSYKSYIKITDKVLTKTFGSETFNGFDCSLICRNDTIDGFAWYVNEDFDNKSGYIMINKTEGIDKNLCPVFRFFINSPSDNGKISQFIPNPVDKLNWKSTELSGLSMPSGRYIDLTLGSSGTTYTAPANGWFWFSKIAGTNLYGVSIENKRNGMIIGSDAGALGSGNAVMPVLAGDNVVVRYSATGKTLGFRFIYAQGNQ